MKEYQNYLDQLEDDIEYQNYLDQQQEDIIEHMIQEEYNLMVEIGEYCKEFRINDLKLSRQELAPTVKPQTLAQFERGNSTNIKHYIKYFNAGTPDQQLKFIKGFYDLLKQGEFYD